MIREARVLGLVVLVGAASMLVSLAVIDSFGNPGSESITMHGTRQTGFVYLSYFGSYWHRIATGVSAQNVRLHVSVISIGDYMRRINGQPWSPMNSTIIAGTGLFEFEPQRRGYYVLLVELEGEFERTDFALFYSYSRSVQKDLLGDGMVLIALGAALLALSYVVFPRRYSYDNTH